MINFRNHIKDRYLAHFLWNFIRMNAIKLYWLLVNTGSGNGLVPLRNKPLSEPVLTQVPGCHTASLGHNGLTHCFISVYAYSALTRPFLLGTHSARPVCWRKQFGYDSNVTRSRRMCIFVVKALKQLLMTCLQDRRREWRVINNLEKNVGTGPDWPTEAVIYRKSL